MSRTRVRKSASGSFIGTLLGVYDRLGSLLQENSIEVTGLKVTEASDGIIEIDAGYVNVQEYQSLVTDGDWTAAILEAEAAAADARSIVIYPPTDYLVTDAVTVGGMLLPGATITTSGSGAVTYTGSGQLDLASNAIVNFHNYRSTVVNVPTGSSATTLNAVAFSLGLTGNDMRRALTIEIDVDDNPGNAKRDVFVVLVQRNATNTLELTDVSVTTNTDTGSAPSITLTGPNSGYTYSIDCYSILKGLLSVTMNEDALIARRAQLTISAEPVRAW